MTLARYCAMYGYWDEVYSTVSALSINCQSQIPLECGTDGKLLFIIGCTIAVLNNLSRSFPEAKARLNFGYY